MSIPAVSGPLGVLPATPAGEITAAHNDVGAHPEGVVATQGAARSESSALQPAIEELRRIAARENLEVHLQALPDADVVVMRFVNPATGEVVREFPSEALARTLAELRSRAATRLDQQV